MAAAGRCAPRRRASGPRRDGPTVTVPPGLLVSVLTPVFDTEPAVLTDLIESLRRQTLDRWELCAVDDGSTRDDTREHLRLWAAHDSRVRIYERPSRGGIVAASNDALAMALGDWVLLADHDDVVAEPLVADVAAVIAEHPDVDVVYTDEDKFDRPFHHFDAFFKPDWSPELLLAQDYLGHAVALRRSIVDDAGGFRPGLDGAQDWDLLLRVTERTDRVRHIGRVLYHWRSHPGSTSRGTDAKPYALEAGRRAVADALERRRIDGWVEPVPELPGYSTVRRRLAHPPLVSIVMPTIGAERELHGARVRLVDRALASLASTTAYDEVEIVAVVGEAAPDGLADELPGLARDRPLRVVRDTGRFDFARAVNRGVVHTSGELVLLLNDDIEARRPDWLVRLVEVLQDPEVGVAGARLLYADGRVQHAGVAHHASLPYHPHRGDADGPGYFGEVAVTRNYLAVTGACLLTPRSVYDEVGGLSPRFPINYNDIDYCLKVLQSGRRTAYVGQSVLIHHESATRDPSVTTGEITEWLRWWGHLVAVDPFVPDPRVPAHAPR